MDKANFYEKVIFVANKLNKKEIVLEYVEKALQNNPENISYIISYLNQHRTTNTEINSFDDIISIANSDAENAAFLLKIVQEDLKPRLKSKVLNRLELALANGDQFKTVFNSTFLTYIKQNIPSIFINVKFIYTKQPKKIPIIEEVLLAHVNSIKAFNRLDSNLANNEDLDITPNFIWVHYYAAMHYDFCRNLEEALKYINKAIDSTPSVVEFFMIKSKILKHGGQLEEASKAYLVAKRLDLGDRYLNAKYAKTQVRQGALTEAVETMKEFVKDPLADENLDHFQNMWFELECGYTYLKKKEILKAHRLFKFILLHFNTLVEDQVTKNFKQNFLIV